MRVKVTFVSNEINIQKSDAEVLLLLFQSAAYNGAIFPPRYSLHIEEQDFAFRRQGYNINRPLLENMHIDMTALREKPVGS